MQVGIMQALMWAAKIQPFCLIPSDFNVDLEILQNVMWNINDVIGQEVLSVSKTCTPQHNTLTFGPTSTGAAATTTYTHTHGIITQVDVTLDVRVVQSQALAHNCLLHEFLHVLTLQHNNDETSIMNLKLMVTSEFAVIQHVDYKGLSLQDAIAIQTIFNVYHTIPNYVFPTANAWSHISGTNNFIDRLFIPIPKSLTGDKLEYWLLKEYKETKRERRRELRKG